MHAEQVTPVCATHGEGPVWDENAGLLRWVDMLAGDILALTAAGVDRLHVAGVAAALRPRAGGGLVVATERGFALVDSGGGIGPEVAAFTDPGARMNDGGADRQGRFLCGSMDFAMAEPRGALYRLDPDLQVTAVLDGVTVSNGICWTADGEQMYYIDSMTRQVDVFDYDTASGRPSGRRAHAVVDVHGAIPDGMALDAKGGIWVAIYGGSAVHRYDPAGRLDAIVGLPVSQVTACAFGGPALDELFITTSGQDLPAGAEPAAGALFRLRPGVTGLSAGVFAG